MSHLDDSKINFQNKHFQNTHFKVKKKKEKEKRKEKAFTSSKTQDGLKLAITSNSPS